MISICLIATKKSKINYGDSTLRIIITGALGHIGSYLTRFLAHEFHGAEIIMIDNMLTQRYPSLFNLPSIGKYKFKSFIEK